MKNGKNRILNLPLVVVVAPASGLIADVIVVSPESGIGVSGESGGIPFRRRGGGVSATDDRKFLLDFLPAMKIKRINDHFQAAGTPLLCGGRKERKRRKGRKRRKRRKRMERGGVAGQGGGDDD